MWHARWGQAVADPGMHDLNGKNFELETVSRGEGKLRLVTREICSCVDCISFGTFYFRYRRVYTLLVLFRTICMWMFFGGRCRFRKKKTWYCRFKNFYKGNKSEDTFIEGINSVKAGEKRSNQQKQMGKFKNGSHLTKVLYYLARQ